MVLHAADKNGLAIVVGKNSAEVTMQFVPQRTIEQERSPVLR